jgi:hypothetical protein
VLLVQVAVLHVWVSHVPQLIVPPQPFDTTPHAFAGQVTSGWQQLLLKQIWLLVQQTPLQHSVVQLLPGWPFV